MKWFVLSGLVLIAFAGCTSSPSGNGSNVDYDSAWLDLEKDDAADRLVVLAASPGLQWADLVFETFTRGVVIALSEQAGHPIVLGDADGTRASWPHRVDEGDAVALCMDSPAPKDRVSFDVLFANYDPAASFVFNQVAAC